MKQLTIILFTMFYSIVTVAQTPTIPEKSSKYINDYADVLTDKQEESLAAIVKAQEQKSTAQIAVVITNDVPPDYPIAMYAQDLFTKWGIGQKGLNNGLLILVFPNNRKARVQPGYGLEGILPDAYTSSVQREYMTPYFKQGDYYGGLNSLLQQIVIRIDPETQAQLAAIEQKNKKEQAEFWSNFWNFLAWVAGGGLLLWLGIYSYRKKKREEKEVREAAERAELERQRQEAARRREEERRIAAEHERQERVKKLMQDLRQTYRWQKDKMDPLVKANFLNSDYLLSQLLMLEPEIDALTGKVNPDNIQEFYNDYNRRILNLTSPILRNWDIHNYVQQTKSEADKCLNNKESFINSCLNDIKKLSDEHGIEIWNHPVILRINPDTIKEQIEKLMHALQYEISHATSTDDYILSQAHAQSANDAMKKLMDIGSEIHHKPSQIDEAQNFINKTMLNLQSDLSNTTGIVNNGVVNFTIQEQYAKYVQTINLKRFTDTHYCVLDRHAQLADFLSNIEEYKARAKKDIADHKAKLEREAAAERERIRRKREEEEEEERRKRRRREEGDSLRHSSYDSSSSYSSYSSSSSSSDSSSSNSTDYGGGSSGGGGSDSSW